MLRCGLQFYPVRHNNRTMDSLFVLALALVACQALDLETEWEAFKVKHGKTYLSATHVSTTRSSKFLLVFIISAIFCLNSKTIYLWLYFSAWWAQVCLRWQLGPHRVSQRRSRRRQEVFLAGRQPVRRPDQRGVRGAVHRVHAPRGHGRRRPVWGPASSHHRLEGPGIKL